MRPGLPEALNEGIVCKYQIQTLYIQVMSDSLFAACSSRQEREPIESFAPLLPPLAAYWVAPAGLASTAAVAALPKWGKCGMLVGTSGAEEVSKTITVPHPKGSM